MIQNDAVAEQTIVSDAIRGPSKVKQLLDTLAGRLAIVAITTRTNPLALFDTLVAVLETLRSAPLDMPFGDDDPRTAKDAHASAMEKFNASKKANPDLGMDGAVTITSGELMILITYSSPVITGQHVEAVDVNGERVL